MEPLTRDPYLWQKARARTKFQSHLVVYLLVNAGLWALWALSPREQDFLPWPLWPSLFWGLGVALNGIGAYGGFGREQRTQREYERLLRAQPGRSA